MEAMTDELTVRLHERGLRMTPQRELVLAAVRELGHATPEQLSDAVQAGAYRPLDRTVDVQVGRLRRRLSAVMHGRDWIETVRGEGYAFVPRGSLQPDPRRDAARTL